METATDHVDPLAGHSVMFDEPVGEPPAEAQHACGRCVSGALFGNEFFESPNGNLTNAGACSASTSRCA